MRAYKKSLLTTKFLYVLVLLTVVAGFATVASRTILNDSSQQKLSKTIVVDKSGRYDFKTIQSAIDSIPENNNEWIRIRVKSGVYGEKVEIPSDKPFIVLEGEGMQATIIAWGDHDRLDKTPTFSCATDDFVARHLSFYNTYNHPLDSAENENPRKQAVAARIQGDRISFYDCGFYGLQDTLWDVSGLHYFKSCFIEGAVDFIFGSAQSIYENCAISVIAEGLSVMKKTDDEEFVAAGFITAQGRDSLESPSAFVFKGCQVFGTGKVYLGRAWRSHSTVLFYRSKLTDVVVPEGWNSWDYAGHEDKIMYAESGCYGLGSNMSQRVDWMKTLSQPMIDKMTSLTFIDKEGWIREQP
ncbi:hypothetical protein MKW94_010218 [Papaver nudicaule]|uniref:Pectinesterase n=1 Tax=Papaver nudicaule TaxID=74823 RepID=A0AA41VK51_PAPNU|nr:hypothetical protein [Papaver nudicaule]